MLKNYDSRPGMGNDGLIDTTILIDYLNDHPPAISWLENFRMTSSFLGVSVITYAELIFGAHDKNEIHKIDDLIDYFQVVHLNQQISIESIGLIKNFAKSHALGIADGLIAATGKVYKLNLYTLNIKHFSMISGLRALMPY